MARHGPFLADIILTAGHHVHFFGIFINSTQHRKNVGYASTCNAVGQTAGFFLGNVVYLTLDSPDFANRFFRSEPLPYGLVSLSGWCFVLPLLICFSCID
ncbi:Acetyl-coenzyme A transporter 1 [Toxocara canis]|uniref:Acetyl-coenzyme A transporter 1 n=1 Tax=Toxocara canis TaxID=6265 RepID=A0A0B2VRL0_TOXCA|nr:Acetyl-coenzyme A transporter 1 [Toxocara canis]